MYPARLRGRVVGVIGMGRAAAGALAAFAGGLIADRLGGPPAVAHRRGRRARPAPSRTSACARRPPSDPPRSRRVTRSARCGSGRPRRGRAGPGVLRRRLDRGRSALRARPRRPARPVPRRRRRHRDPHGGVRRRSRSRSGAPSLIATDRSSRSGSAARSVCAALVGLCARAARRRALARRAGGRDRERLDRCRHRRRRQRPDAAGDRAAAMAGWNAFTGARGIVAAFLMTACCSSGSSG